MVSIQGKKEGTKAGDGGFGGAKVGGSEEEGVRIKEIPMWRFVGFVGKLGDLRSKPGRVQETLAQQSDGSSHCLAC
jgi:hypothetical protein